MLFYALLGDKEIARLIRFGGPGLGNLLFPYCRAYIYSLQYNGMLIPPIWPTIKLGPLLRGELDTRLYFGLFKSTLKQRAGFIYDTLAFQDVSEELFLKSPKHFEGTKHVIVVKGLNNYFEDLKLFKNEIHLHLLSIATEKVRRKVTSFSASNIGIHIRMGDYKTEWRTPLSWYAKQVKTLKSHSLFQHCQIVIFSDGTDDELQPLLSEGCKRATTPDALADIFRLAKCKIIIGSNSTFSAWAAFLSESPFIRPENFYMGRLRSDYTLYEGESLTQALNSHSS